jgi:hypothetical protein
MAIKATCDLKHSFTIEGEDAKRQAVNCPECKLLTWNPSRPKREKIEVGATAVVGDSDRWNPWCSGMGELDPMKKAQRIKDGTIRKNPKTGNYEGYFDTHHKYREALHEHGVINSWGEGKINEARQGWDPNQRDKR